MAVVGLVVLLLQHRGEPRKLSDVVASAHPAWLLLAAVLQAGTYVSIALIWKAVLRRLHARAPHLGRLMRLSVAELFTDQLVPSGGMSGTMLVVTSLKRRHVPARAATAAVVSSLIGFYVAQLVLVVASVVVFASAKHFGGWEASTSLAAFVAAVVMPLPLVATLFAAHKLPRRVRRLRAICHLYMHIRDIPKDVVFSPSMMATATSLRIVVLLLDATTLMVCLAAVGNPVSPLLVVAAYTVAFVVGSASFLPGGIGTFEAAVVALLVDVGTPIEAAVPATLLMRLLSFWLPMIPGVWFAHREVAPRAQVA
jgi:uncharacterized protein (TIRG00374 family)